MSTSDDQIEELHRSAVTRGDQYYIDPLTGFFVMTEIHHLDRGTCCTNNCRHCPFRDQERDQA